MTIDEKKKTEFTFSEFAKALYGTRWQSNLAGGLEASTRSVRRWRRDPTTIPQWVWNDIRRQIKERQRLLTLMIADLAEEEREIYE